MGNLGVSEIGLLYVGSIVLCVWLARRRNLRVELWALASLVFGPLALLAVALVPTKQAPSLSSPTARR